jgi:large subunit ribosomal protein L32
MGAICPKGRVSKSKRDKRRAQTWKITAPNLVVCSKCGKLMTSHRACRACGSYNKREVVKVVNQ